ncbi:MAG: lytic transglycosylase domain-containing protein [Nitrosomonadales bacterium]|nr:lytic transglycosylase domain-containing protein [Nitrosomonadales bacterium]
MRLALEANNVSLANSLIEQLEEKHAGLPALLKDAAADPERYLKKLSQEKLITKKGAHPTVKQTAIDIAIQAPVSSIEQPPFTLSLESPPPPSAPLIKSPSADWFGLKNLLSRLSFDKTDVPRAALAALDKTAKADTDSVAEPLRPASGVSTECSPPCADIKPEVTASAAELHPKLASEAQRTVALFALQRLAKQSPDLAIARWEKIAGYFPVIEQRYFYGRLAYEAARNLDARALQWYKAAAYTPLDERQTAWRVRAALRALNWSEVLAGIDAMSEQQQRDPAWKYWKARALQALGKTVEAREIFAPLSKDFYFYGQLASAELADFPIMSAATPAYKPDPQAISEMLTQPGMQRTMALYRMNLRSEALEEWRWLMRNLNDRELLTAAEIAKRNEMYDRAIGAADRTVSVHDFSMRYLAPYRTELQTHIREHGLDEAWVYGLMRQESRFTTSAKSDVGASGLMQIMPSTARWVAKKLGLKSYRNALIHQLDTNLRLGTYYMKAVLAQSENNPVLASASYNAGPLRALQWRGDQPLEGAIYAETIPFEETRDYVKKVMSNTVYYAEQFGDPPRSLKQRLGIIPAKSAEKLAIP